MTEIINPALVWSLITDKVAELLNLWTLEKLGHWLEIFFASAIINENLFNIFQVLATLGRQDTDTNRSAGNDPSNGPDNDSGMDLWEDDENMVRGSKGMPMQGSAFGSHRINHNRDKHLRYRTRVFAAEYDLAYLSSLPFMFPCLAIYILISVKLFLLITRKKNYTSFSSCFTFQYCLDLI